MYELLFSNGYTTSEERNERICTNVQAALAAAKIKRVLIMFGLDHKYFLERCVSALSIPLTEIGAWLRPEALANYRVDSRIAKAAELNVERSSRLLRQRLQAGYYQSPLKERLEKKLESFPRWSAKLEELSH